MKVSFPEFYHFLQPFFFLSFETFMSIHKISISLRVHNEQRSETKLFTKGFNSFSCPNPLTKVSTLHCHKVNRLGQVVDQQSSQRYSERKQKTLRVVLEINPIS